MMSDEINTADTPAIHPALEWAEDVKLHMQFVPHHDETGVVTGYRLVANFHAGWMEPDSGLAVGPIIPRIHLFAAHQPEAVVAGTMSMAFAALLQEAVRQFAEHKRKPIAPFIIT